MAEREGMGERKEGMGTVQRWVNKEGGGKQADGDLDEIAACMEPLVSCCTMHAECHWRCHLHPCLALPTGHQA